MIRVARPQNALERAADLASWRQLAEDKPRVLAAWQCQGINRYGRPCGCVGNLPHEGKKYCKAHYWKLIQQQEKANG